MARVSLEAALNASAVAVGLGGMLAGLEGLALRREYATAGLLDAAVAPRGRRLVSSFSPPSSWARFASCGCIVFSMAVFLSLAGGWLPLKGLAMAGLALCLVLSLALLPYGHDGADDMAIVVTLPLAAAGLLSDPHAVAEAALLFVAAQLGLSYLAAGAAKATGPYWRDGSAFARIAATRSYGSPGLAKLMRRHPRLGRVGSWAAVGWELAMPVALVLGSWLALVGLALGLGFHLAIAWLMGLNRFVPWFFAAYPAAFYASSQFGVLS